MKDSSVANKMNQTGNHVEIRPHIHVTMKSVLYEICTK